MAFILFQGTVGTIDLNETICVLHLTYLENEFSRNTFATKHGENVKRTFPLYVVLHGKAFFGTVDKRYSLYIPENVHLKG